ncbi:MAG: SGNH/GDSL hydrolase family protein [Chthoniobacteraceae bacterium]
MKFILTLITALLLAPVALVAAEPGDTSQAHQAPEKDDPNLPRVMIIGDSISVGYTDEVRKLLAGKANVHRVAGNAGPSSSGIQKMAEWIAPTNGTWNVIHFNFGLHDLKLGTGGKDNHPYATSDGHQVSLEDYERNLNQIVAKFKTTGATLIWCSTTPVPAGKVDPPRQPDDVIKYNEVARKVMIQNGVAIDDLYALALPKLADIQLPHNVHYTREGYAELARQVAARIKAALK